MAQPGASDSGEFSRPMRAAAALRRMCPDVEGFHFPREPNEPYYFESEVSVPLGVIRNDEV